MTPEDNETNPAPPTFDSMPLSAELRQAIADLGYTHPTPVQRAVYEPAVRGRDLVVQARTGTGKTAAFGMPIVDALVRRNQPAVQALILCPTRELALQVHRELDVLGTHREVRSVAVYGGAPMLRQIEQIRQGPPVLVGTPGRILDHLQRGSLDVTNVKTAVLDESDEMLSMGFLPQIDEIFGYLPESRQTLLFSATLPPDIQRMAETRLRDPLFLTLSGDHIGALDIEHLVYYSHGDKLSDLERVLEVENPESAILFCNTRDETKRVAAALERKGYAADWLNADLAQADREKVMAATRQGKLRFLVCTDVAARGIDISHLTHVINFDFPESAESYVHRTGRTGRAGRSGQAISLIRPSDVGNLYLLRLTYKICPIERQLPTAREMKTRAELDLVDIFVEAFANRAIHGDDLSLARRMLTHERAERVLAGLLRDHLGGRPEIEAEAADSRRAKTPRAEVEASASASRTSKAAEPAPSSPPKKANGTDQRTPKISQSRRPTPPEPAEPKPGEGDEFSFAYSVSDPPGAVTGANDSSRLDVRGKVEPPEQASDADATDLTKHDSGELTSDRAEIFVNVGRRSGARLDDFVAALGLGGVAESDTEYIHVRYHHSFVGVRRDAFERALDALNGATIGGKTAVAEPARSMRP